MIFQPPNCLEVAISMAVNYNASLSEASVNASRNHFESAVPMELSLAEKGKLCFFCKKPGHFIKDCRKRIAMEAKSGAVIEVNKDQNSTYVKELAWNEVSVQQRKAKSL